MTDTTPPQPQEPPRDAPDAPDAPTLDQDMADLFQAVLGAVADATFPVLEAFQRLRAEYLEQGQAAARLLTSHERLHQSLTDLVAYVDRQSVHPNWAQDRATLEGAKATLAALDPERTPQ